MTELEKQLDALPDCVIEATAEAIGGAMDCLRVWSAWGVGTMSADDFAPVADDGERVAEIARAAITAYLKFSADASPQTTPEQGWIDKVMEQAQVFASAWSLVGSRFDRGGELENAEEQKRQLRAFISGGPVPDKKESSDD